jgi:molybdenum cofactor cytidylyltransferase
MIFGALPLAEAEGAILAHGLQRPGLVFKKGRRLSAADLAALARAGVSEVIAARLEPGDVGEDAAAAAIAAAATGPGLTMSAAFTGRCNLIVAERGLLLLERARVDALNALDEAITLATLAPFEIVEPRQMAATVKIIPFAAPSQAVEQAVALAGRGRPLLAVAPFRPRRVGLVQTTLPGLKPAILDKTLEATNRRLAALDCPPAEERRVPHEPGAIAAALAELKHCEILLVSGASANVDRRDVVPAGIVAVGGEVLHFGMPVDPGNLILLARWGDKPVLGLPGCARSPKVNGFDWVLERLVAGLAVTPRDIQQMGVGGLLKETGARPLPRAHAVESRETAPRAPAIAALVLAAGQARRMGSNKLVAELQGKPLLRHAVEAALASQARPVLVVTGHERERTEAALSGLGVATTHNPDYARGLSTSLHRGLAALSPGVDGAVVLLGDMPRITPAVLNRLIAAFNPVEGRALVVPTFKGKRGNPLLFARRFFAEVQAIQGDQGARQLLGEYPELVAEVALDDDAVLTDVDTPEALAALCAWRS